MIVCICHRVSDRDITRAAREGCASFDELQMELSVATSCGKCHECAHQTFQQHRLARAPEAVASAPVHGARIAAFTRPDAAPAVGA